MELVSPQRWQMRLGGSEETGSTQPLFLPMLTSMGAAGCWPWMTGHWGTGSSNLVTILGSGCSSHSPCGGRDQKENRLEGLGPLTS